jgi:Zn-dependent alcohol dehydrogenase
MQACQAHYALWFPVVEGAAGVVEMVGDSVTNIRFDY